METIATNKLNFNEQKYMDLHLHFEAKKNDTTMLKEVYVTVLSK